MKVFFGFVFISGLGWLCDFVTFTLLVSFFDLPGFISNFVSSYVGVTFVWVTSLRIVFGSENVVRNHHLLIYWGFQLLSILSYSKLLQLLASYLVAANLLFVIPLNVGVISKILITPLNLATNFIFLKMLIHHMHKKNPPYV